MSYESRVFVIDRHDHGDGFVYGGEIARFNLSSMGYEYVSGKQFRDVFKTPIDFDLDIPADESGEYKPELYREDCYGHSCKYATIAAVMEWLEKSTVLREYRRAKLFYDFLKVMQEHESEYREIVLVHYGY